MKPFVLLACILVLAGCGQDSKSPAHPTQPEAPTAADTTRVSVFADISLEAAVREALRKPSGTLTAEDLRSLNQLVARGRGITSLAGIDSLKNLTVLDLADNQIQDLSPLAALTQLAFLDLESNKIQDISPLAALAQLATLVLGFNVVSDLSPLAGLGQLHSVGLEGNPLSAAAQNTQVPALQARGVHVSVGVPGGQPVLSVGSIVFASDRAGNDDLYALDVDGSYAVQLTQDPADDTQPVWSPDWTRLAFVSNSAGKQQIYVVNADGSELKQVTDGRAKHKDPCWSPDGRRIAYSRLSDANWDICAIEVDRSGAWVLGKDEANLTRDAAMDVQPSWSPDGPFFFLSLPCPENITRTHLRTRCRQEPDRSPIGRTDKSLTCSYSSSHQK